MVVVALLSVDLVESVDLVSVVLVVNCTHILEVQYRAKLKKKSLIQSRPCRRKGKLVKVRIIEFIKQKIVFASLTSTTKSLFHYDRDLFNRELNNSKRSAAYTINRFLRD